MLGRLEMESGRVRDGAERLFLAAELDPRTATSLALVARSALFRGKPEIAARVRRRVVASPVLPLEHLLLVLRRAVWGMGKEEVDEVRAAVTTLAIEPARTLLTSMLAAVDGDPQPMLAWSDYVDQAAAKSRYRVLQHQLCVEVAPRDVERAMHHLESADAAGLFDLEWLEQCPALAPLRQEPRFVRVRESVARRVLRL